MSLSARLNTLHGINLEAAARRARLRNPPNAVKDTGINLEKPVKGASGARYAQLAAARRKKWEAEQEAKRAKEEARKVGLFITNVSGKVVGVFALEGGLRAEVLVVFPARVRPTVAEIQKEVCRQFRVAHTDLISHRRAMYIAEPRQIAASLCGMLTLHSLAEIGRRFGGRDHSTVIHSCEKFKWLIDLVRSGTTNDTTLGEIVALAKHYYERGPQLEAAE